MQAVQALPDNVTWAEAVERIQIAAALAKAEEEIDAGRAVSQAEAERYIDACLRKLSGPSAA